MVMRKIVGFAVLVAAGFNAQAVVAQSIADVAQASRQQTASSPRITVRFNKAVVEDALQEIAKQANYRLVYERTRLPLTNRISANLKSVPVNDALSVVLRGTGATARIAADG